MGFLRSVSFLRRFRRGILLILLPVILVCIFIQTSSNLQSVSLAFSVQCKDGGCYRTWEIRSEYWDIASQSQAQFRDKSGAVLEDDIVPRDSPQSQLIPGGPGEPSEILEGATSTPPVDIVIWATKRLSRGRYERLKRIQTSMSNNICFDGCRLSVSRNESEVELADAVVFFMFTNGYRRHDLPERKRRNQIWIYNQHEPPPNYTPGAHLNRLFHWTMTYRLDSDVYQPYYRKFPLERITESLYFGINNVSIQEWIAGKTGLATAVISNCRTRSRRETILNKLKASGLPIDIYGRCGNRTFCPRYSRKCPDLWMELSSKYKFYFAFENSLCSDYITEKFWRSLDLGIVPVVLGRAKYLEVAPPKSYIDLRDFASPEGLRDYLQILHEDPYEYAKYFEWRREYQIHSNADDFCDLCGKLKEHKRRKGRKPVAYKSIGKWWRSEPGRMGQPACISPEDMGLNEFL